MVRLSPKSYTHLLAIELPIVLGPYVSLVLTESVSFYGAVKYSAAQYVCRIVTAKH